MCQVEKYCEWVSGDLDDIEKAAEVDFMAEVLDDDEDMEGEDDEDF